MVKSSLLPNPMTYQNKNEMSKRMNQARSILGGSIEDKPLKDNGVPGPGTYMGKPITTISGFVIMQANNRARRDATNIEMMKR